MNAANRLDKPTQNHNPDAKPKGLLAGLSERLARTRQSIVGQVQSLIRRKPVLDAEFLDELEAILLQADVGVNTTERLLSGISRSLKEGGQGQALSGEDVLGSLKEEIVEVLGPPEPLGKAVEGPTVIMVVGVNGTGKTTTVGKLCQDSCLSWEFWRQAPLQPSRSRRGAVSSFVWLSPCDRDTTVTSWVHETGLRISDKAYSTRRPPDETRFPHNIGHRDETDVRISGVIAVIPVIT
jgi:hypothetical protein